VFCADQIGHPVANLGTLLFHGEQEQAGEGKRNGQADFCFCFQYVMLGKNGVKAEALRGTLSFGVLLDLIEHAIQFGLSLDDFARFNERLELLFHRLADGRWIAPAVRPFLHGLLHALDFFSEALARRFGERRAAGFGDFFQFGLLLWRQEILDPGEQTNMQTLQIAFRIKHLVELGGERRLVHSVLSGKGRERGGFAGEPLSEFVGSWLYLFNMGAKGFPLFLRQTDLVGCHQDHFGREKSSCQRIGLSDGLFCRGQAASSGQENDEGYNFHSE